MTQEERLQFLLRYLINESERHSQLRIPHSPAEQKRLLRTLMNIRPPRPASADFFHIQDQYLRQEAAAEKITDLNSLAPVKGRIFLWQGDITKLKCDAIVNAANSSLLGCFIPCHGCIDNAIHTRAGVQLRLACHALMRKKSDGEKAGGAQITKAFNLPCQYVLHTVGPMISGSPSEQDFADLSSCYASCLALAEKSGVRSLAFCCISTGEFHFPPRQAAETAVRTVTEYLKKSKLEKVVFNVFKDRDYDIYRTLLS